MGGAIGGTSLLVAVLVVVGTFALTLQQRQRELALLRAIAATPRQIRGLIGREALVVALVAGLLGARRAPGFSARRVARLRPAESLTEAAVERRPGLGRLLAGLLVLSGGVV